MIYNVLSETLNSAITYPVVERFSLLCLLSDVRVYLLVVCNYLFSASITLKQEDVFNISSFYLLNIVALYSCHLRASYLVVLGLSNISCIDV